MNKILEFEPVGNVFSPNIGDYNDATFAVRHICIRAVNPTRDAAATPKSDCGQNCLVRKSLFV